MSTENAAITLLKSIRAKLMAAPELNMGNYTADEVAELNATVGEVICEIDNSGLDLGQILMVRYTCNGSPKGCEGERFGGCAYCEAMKMLNTLG